MPFEFADSRGATEQSATDGEIKPSAEALPLSLLPYNELVRQYLTSSGCHALIL
jgi:hypothetical protein